MLLATYALLTLAIERTEERASIQVLQDFIAHPRQLRPADGAELASRSEELIRFAESHHQDRLANALFPALREKSDEAGDALRRHERLCRAGLAIVPRIRRILRAGEQQSEGARVLVQAYCRNLLARLASEEDILLPMAERLLPSDVWFDVGTRFLDQDARRA